MNVSGLAVSCNKTQTIVSIMSLRLLRIKYHDHDILTLHQPIRLQHFEQGNKKS